MFSVVFRGNIWAGRCFYSFARAGPVLKYIFCLYTLFILESLHPLSLSGYTKCIQQCLVARAALYGTFYQDSSQTIMHSCDYLIKSIRYQFLPPVFCVVPDQHPRTAIVSSRACANNVHAALLTSGQHLSLPQFEHISMSILLQLLAYGLHHVL